jgi:hypothetical protein
VAAKKSTKREFDWRSYTKPARLLSPEQEAALLGGVLEPLLRLALDDPALSLEIRARQATLYSRGASLVRLRGAEAPFIAEIDANLRLPKAERAGAEQLETFSLATAADVSALLGELESLGAVIERWAAGEPAPSTREHLTRFAAANNGADEGDELIVVDIEYQYGRRKFDFIGMRRAAGVGGLGAFSTPRLVIGELRSPGRPLTGNSALSGFGSDAAEFAHALAGEHLIRAKAELADLIAQKVRLGLLPEDLPFMRFTEDLPELLAVFTDPNFAEPELDAPIAELHDKLVARRFPTELLCFTATGEAAAAYGGDAEPRVWEDDVMAYRAFKGFRKRLVSQ